MWLTQRRFDRRNYLYLIIPALAAETVSLSVYDTNVTALQTAPTEQELLNAAMNSAIAAIAIVLSVRVLCAFALCRRLMDISDSKTFRFVRYPLLIFILISGFLTVCLCLRMALFGCTAASCEAYITFYQAIIINTSDPIIYMSYVTYLLLLGLAFPRGTPTQNSFGSPPQLQRSLISNSRMQERIDRNASALRRYAATQSLNVLTSAINNIAFAANSRLLSTLFLATLSTWLGAIITVIGGFFVFDIIFSPLRLARAILDGQVGVPEFIALFGFVAFMLFAGRALLYFGRRLHQRIKTAKVILQSAAREPVALYLRPFGSDHIATIVPRDAGSRNRRYRVGTIRTLITMLRASFERAAFWGAIWIPFTGVRYLWTYRPWVPKTAEQRIRAKLLDRLLPLFIVNSYRVSIEQFLETELSECSRLLALGLDDIGIARIPSTDDDWQRKLAWLIDRCQCILYVPGATAGALTEFELLCDGQLSKTIFVSARSSEHGLRRLWRRSRFSFEESWNTAVSTLLNRRPDLVDILSKLVYRPEGRLYRVGPETHTVESYQLRADELVRLVYSALSINLTLDNSATLKGNITAAINSLGCSGEVESLCQGHQVLRAKVRMTSTRQATFLARRAHDFQFSLGIPAKPLIKAAREFAIIDFPRTDREIPSLRPGPGGGSIKENKDSITFPIGVDVCGKGIMVDLFKRDGWHILIAGRRSSGKTEWLKVLTSSLARQVSGKQIVFAFIESQPYAFSDSRISRSPYLWRLGDCDSEIGVLRAAVREMDNRLDELVNNERVDSHGDLRRDLSEIPHIVIVFDEIPYSILSGGNDGRREFVTLVNRIVNSGGSVGIHIIIATRHYESALFANLNKSNFSIRICFGVDDPLISEKIVGEPGGECLMGMGDMLVNFGKEAVRAQGYFVPQADFLKSFGSG
jgi:hypothetical protein